MTGTGIMDIRKRAKQIMDDRTRITAVLMLFVVLLFLLASAWFIAHEADHDCTGEDCPVCALIRISENNLRQLGSGAPAAAAAVSFILIIMMIQPGTDGGITISTPVSRKTRLNN